MIRFALTAFVLLSVFSVAKAADDASCAVKPDATVFNRCRVCHSVSPGADHLSGPNLWAIIGRAAGMAPGYVYSDAVKSSDIVWSASAVREYLDDPSAYLPGTRMMSAPIKDAEVLNGIVCYLQSLTAIDR